MDTQTASTVATIISRFLYKNSRKACLCIVSMLALTQVAKSQQAILGNNLIVNSDAEAGSAATDISHPVTTIPNWTRGGVGNVSVLPYTITNYLVSSSPAPPNHGFQYFVGAGYPGAATLSQDIDVSAGASVISAGNVKYTISGYMGSSNPSDYFGTAQIGVAFKNAAGQTFTTATVGPLAYPGNGLVLQQQMGLVPSGTTRITVTLSFVGINGGNGAVDNLSLVLTTLDTSPGKVLGHNLVVNGGAEGGPNSPPNVVVPYIPGWSSDTASVAPYGGTNWVALTATGPADRGVNAFCGRAALGSSNMYQDIDVSAAATLIDAGSVTYNIAAWLGRVSGNYPGATLKYTFFDWSDPPKQLAATAQLIANPVPGNGLAEVSNAASLPPGTRRVRIEVDFVGAGGGGGDLADNIVFTLSAPGGPPVITPAGIVSAGAFGGFTAIAPGSWIEIYGLNLAPAMQNWAGTDFVNGVAPTSLSNVSVSIGGLPAFIDFISPGQVNALVPSNVPAGPVTITITTANGISDAYGIYVNQTQPGLLAPPSFTVAGKQYAAALFSDGQTFALPVNAITGVASRPAKPGETLTIYGVGFGPVTGGFTAGTIVTAQNALMNQFLMQFGATQATVSYQGLAPSFTGLYQFNVVVPNITPNNALALSFSLGGTKGTQTLYIAVGN